MVRDSNKDPIIFPQICSLISGSTQLGPSLCPKKKIERMHAYSMSPENFDGFRDVGLHFVFGLGCGSGGGG